MNKILDSFFVIDWKLMFGVLLVVVAFYAALVANYASNKRKVSLVIIFAIGFAISTFRFCDRGVQDGWSQGVNFATYHVAKFYTQPVPKEKLKDNVVYYVWNHMLDRNTSLVLGEDETVLLVTGITGIPIETEFTRSHGEIFIKTKGKTTEKK